MVTQPIQEKSVISWIDGKKDNFKKPCYVNRKYLSIKIDCIAYRFCGSKKNCKYSSYEDVELSYFADYHIKTTNTFLIKLQFSMFSYSWAHYILLAINILARGTNEICIYCCWSKKGKKLHDMSNDVKEVLLITVNGVDKKYAELSALSMFNTFKIYYLDYIHTFTNESRSLLIARTKLLIHIGMWFPIQKNKDSIYELQSGNFNIDYCHTVVYSWISAGHSFTYSTRVLRF